MLWPMAKPPKEREREKKRQQIYQNNQGIARQMTKDHLDVQILESRYVNVVE